MTDKFTFEIPRPAGSASMPVSLDVGQSMIFIGANGAGKTRLGVHIERQLESIGVHRISAHRSLAMNPKISLIALESALNMLRYGNDNDTSSIRNKTGNRWGSKPETHLLNDFDSLQMALFAEHNRAAVEYRQNAMDGGSLPTTPTKLAEHSRAAAVEHQQNAVDGSSPPIVPTNLEKLKRIWNGLLPHRQLHLREASIEVCISSACANGCAERKESAAGNIARYPGSDMSDGERAIFYFLGQCLSAPENSALVIDEPESHIHKAILSPLWNAIEKDRKDCAFIYVTHDLDFAIASAASKKFFVKAYHHVPMAWDVEVVPTDTDLPEHVVAELVGSRRPILFVEGERRSLDLTLYRYRYAEFTIVPVGPCDAVIHSVSSYRERPFLHRLNAYGLIDADGRDTGTPAPLPQGVFTLPVSEIENLLLLPSVFLVLADAVGLSDPRARLERLTQAVFSLVKGQLDEVSTRHTIRQLDRQLKRLALAKPKNLPALETAYASGLARISPTDIFNTFKAQLEKSIVDADLPQLLRLYDNKGLLAIASSVLGFKNIDELMERVARQLSEHKNLAAELRKVLPDIQVTHDEAN